MKKLFRAFRIKINSRITVIVMEQHTLRINTKRISGVYTDPANTDTANTDTTNTDTANTETDKYGYVLQLSVKDKIALICSACVTNADLLISIKNTGVRLTKQQSSFIMKLFVQTAYDPKYMAILIDMGFDLTVLQDMRMVYDLGIKHVPYGEHSVLYQALRAYKLAGLSGFDSSLIRLIFGEPLMNRYYKLIKNEEYHADNKSKSISSKRLKWIAENQASCKDEFEQSNLDLLNDLLGVLDKNVKVQGFCTGNMIGFYNAGISLNDAEYIRKVHSTLRLLVKHGLNLNGSTQIIVGYKSKCIYDFGNLVELLAKSIEQSEDYDLSNAYIKLLLDVFDIDGYRYIPTGIHPNINAYVSLVKAGVSKYGMANDSSSTFDTDLRSTTLEHMLMYSSLLEKVLIKINNFDDFISFAACSDYVIGTGSSKLLDVFLLHTARVKARIEEINRIRSYYSKYMLIVSEQGYYDMAKTLLSIGADVDYVAYGDTALKIACRLGDLNLATLLLDNGADIMKFDGLFVLYRSIISTARSTLWRNDELVALLEKRIPKK